MDLAIFGAQGYALGAYTALKTLYPKRTVPCFLVSAMENNAPELGGIPVREVVDYSGKLTSDEKNNIEILIATPDNVQPEIEETLENHGFKHYRRLTSDRWDELMKMFHIKMGRFMPITALPVGYNSPFVRIYMAKSHGDRPLIEASTLPEYVQALQVGTANTTMKLATLTDDKGDSISYKNGNYSELTGLYWMWKNKLAVDAPSDDGSQYYGLAQYRRLLELSEDDLLRLVDNDVDVILPYPMPYEPNIHAHHKRYLKDADWKALLSALSELQPEYADVFEDVLEQQYLYNFNVILARKSVLKDYCEWLFPILERTEELSVPKGSARSDRYIGYMAETLETLYFMKNADKLNIVHTGCRMLV
jgi:hypothetical protein